MPLQLDRCADQFARAYRIGFVAHQQAHLLAAVGHGIGKGGDLFLSARKKAGPFLGQMRKADPQPILRVPFGRHHSVGHERPAFTQAWVCEGPGSTTCLSFGATVIANRFELVPVHPVGPAGAVAEHPAKRV